MDNAYFAELCETYQYNFEEPNEVFSAIRRAITTSLNDLSCIDFDEMLWLPVIWDLPFDKQDYVFVDEAQDTNSVQLSILGRLAKPGQRCEGLGVNDEWHEFTDVSPTRYVFVGDPHQAIYGFRGANSDSMELIAKRFGCEKMPLSVSFRCPKLGVAESRKFLGETAKEDIKPHADAIEGKVEHLSVYNSTHFQPGHAILCRNNAPLVAFAYSLLKRDIPCVVLGKDFGAQLVSIVKKMRATSLEDCCERLDKYFTREIAKAVDEDKNPERLADQRDCLMFFVESLDEDSRSVESLIAKIDLMFGEPSDGNLDRKVVLSSIHKSKGLEFPVIFFLDRGLLPSKYATQPWQSQQEKNLGYVATTRWQRELYYIQSGCWKKDE
jgi:superfamily I DNA/RNA helicase